MRERAFVVIVLFWAVLTILTPTLILLSESSKPYLHPNVDEGGGIVNARRMMGHAEKQPRREIIASTAMESPAPAPVPESVLGNRWSDHLRRFFLE